MIINKMNKKTLISTIAVILIIVLVIGGYFYLSKKAKENLGTKALEKIGGAAEKLTEDATKGVLPSIQTNPLENKPDINPADKANPYKNIKINPFE